MSRNSLHALSFYCILTITLVISEVMAQFEMLDKAFRNTLETIGIKCFRYFDSVRDTVKSYIHREELKVPYIVIKKRRPKSVINTNFNKFDDQQYASMNRKRSTQRKIIGMTTLQLIELHGYKSQTHKVMTRDGYCLTLHRILSPYNNSLKIKPKTYFLHHGLQGSSADWILLGPNKSLPYMLINEGHDVWLANARGNKYSKYHYQWPIDSNEFWDFSWHEIGQFDLSASLDYIRRTNNGTSKLHFIGHSMGATALLVLFSMYPQYNYIIESAVLLAPLAFMYHTKGPLRLLAEQLHENDLKRLALHDFTKFTKFPKKVIKKYCVGEPALCSNSFLLIANGGQSISDVDLMWNILTHVPSGGSAKTIVHYCHLMKSGKFHMFDFGETKNLQKYGRKSPPIYRLNKVTVPITVFSSAGDWLSTIEDVQSLILHFIKPVKHKLIKEKHFSHTDFVWGEHASDLVFKFVMQDALNQN